MFLILNVCALKITEIESNPAGIDSGNEWIELYNDGEINLEEYKLVNNDGGEILLNRTISGYFVYILGKQWLDNTDEKISLYKNGELIDETDIFDDTTNNDMTWQLCDDWEFKNSTKGEENSCEAPEEEPQETPSENTEELAKEEPEENFEENQSQTKERETIVLNPLNPQVIKTEEDKKGISKNYALYGFVAFCILIGILFIIKNIKNRKYKNEFR
jgi:hypothetical protein